MSRVRQPAAHASPTRRVVRYLVRASSMIAWGLTAHTAYNLTRLRRPPNVPPPVAEAVSVLLPVRDEERQVTACLAAVSAQTGVADLEILVYDDQSGDRTAALVTQAGTADPRIRLLDGESLPAGWLGKPHACQEMADQARGTVLVFLDADVVLAPHAVAATVGLLRQAGLDLLSPYPRQLAVTLVERVVQPLLPWSWISTLPLGVAERSSRRSLVAANGQLMAVDTATYARAGGHRAVAGEVLDDLGLARAVRTAGGRVAVADGSDLAVCRMYPDRTSLVEGYAKSLWQAFGSPPGAVAVAGVLSTVYLLPPLAALAGSRWGIAGYLGGVAGRALVARRTGDRVWPDSTAHPVSIAVFTGLVGVSVARHRAGTLTWRGRRLA
ncbi:MAG: glycosyltransferase family 2 protein [Actinomycetes bacterium]